jgi:UDP-glucose 4-epimerase
VRTLVTGGAGFIGSTLVDRLLAEGHQVDVLDDLSAGSLANLAAARALDGRSLSFHQIDVRSDEVVELISRRRPEIIFHLAAQAAVPVSVARPLFDAEVNVMGGVKVLEGARAAGTARVIYAASGGTLYGDVPADDLPVNEAHAQEPTTPYGVSKKVVVDYLSMYRKLFGLEFVALALANVYGPRQDPHGEAGVVAIFSQRAVRHEAVTIYGDGEQTRDFVYVDDVVDAFVRAVDRGGGLVCNIGTGRETSVNRVHQAVAEAAGHEVPATHDPPRQEVRHNVLDCARAAMQLGWRPFTSFDEGIAATLGYFSATEGT